MGRSRTLVLSWDTPLFFRLPDDRWLFFVAIILLVFFVLVIIVVRVLRWQALERDGLAYELSTLRRRLENTEAA